MRWGRTEPKQAPSAGTAAEKLSKKIRVSYRISLFHGRLPVLRCWATIHFGFVLLINIHTHAALWKQTFSQQNSSCWFMDCHKRFAHFLVLVLYVEFMETSTKLWGREHRENIDRFKSTFTQISFSRNYTYPRSASGSKKLPASKNKDPLTMRLDVS